MSVRSLTADLSSLIFACVSFPSTILPFDHRLCTLFPTFNHLQTLDISCSAPKNTMYACFTSIANSFFANITVIDRSIRTTDEYFSSSTHRTLFHSQLDKQCRNLSMKIHHRMNILQFAKEMSLLYTLNVHFPSNRYETNNDQFIECLQGQLPFTCMIRRNMTHSN